MISEAIQTLRDIIKQAEVKTAPTVLPLDKNDLRTAYFWDPSTQKIIQQPLKSSPRAHTITTLESLSAAFQRYTAAEVPSVWVCLMSVVCLIDDGAVDSEDKAERRHRLTLPVMPSPLFETIGKLPTSQKDLIAAVRHDLRSAGIDPPVFEKSITLLRWEHSTSAVNEVGTVKDTMGRSAMSELIAAVDIPPEIKLTFVPFPALVDLIPGTVDVDCSVMVEPKDQRIFVRPFPGAIALAMCQATEMLRAKIVALLKCDQTTVFAGTP